MAQRDFDAARRERLRERDPIQFVLHDEVYTCLAVVPVGEALDLADVPPGVTDAEVVRAMASLIDRVLVDDDRKRFAEALRRRDDPVDGVTVLEIGQWLAEAYAGRPTSPSTDSSDGRQSTGPSSSSDADATVSATSAA